MVTSEENIKQDDKANSSVKHCSSTALLGKSGSPFSLDARDTSNSDHLPPTSASSTESVVCRVCQLGVAELG